MALSNASKQALKEKIEKINSRLAELVTLRNGLQQQVSPKNQKIIDLQTQINDFKQKKQDILGDIP